MRALVVALVLLASGPARADDRRATELAHALEALRATPAGERTALADEVEKRARVDCRASFGAPTTGCILSAARAVCDQRPAADRPRCLAIADLVVVSSLAERELVSERTRVELMNSGDYRGALRKELRRRYALLAGEMTLAADFDPKALAASIDRFCLARSRRRPLAWQRCAAGIVWYIGTEPEGSAE